MYEDWLFISLTNHGDFFLCQGISPIPKRVPVITPFIWLPDPVSRCQTSRLPDTRLLSIHFFGHRWGDSTKIFISAVMNKNHWHVTTLCIESHISFFFLQGLFRSKAQEIMKTSTNSSLWHCCFGESSIAVLWHLANSYCDLILTD